MEAVIFKNIIDFVRGYISILTGCLLYRIRAAHFFIIIVVEL